LSYVNLDISDDFADWLETEDNEVLKLRFSDYALTGSRIGWNSLVGSNGGNMDLSFEWSGMASKLLSPLMGWEVSDEGEVKIGEVPVIKFLRVDGSWVMNNKLSNREDMVFKSRFRFGGAFVGEGTETLPYSKGFFGGGLNGIRGWPIRELGPGNYSEESSTQGVLRGVGDYRLDISSEFRFKWTSLTTVALFADAGNIWQNGNGENDGTSWSSSGFSSIAFSAGIGLRLDFEFFLIRLDAALRLHDPTHSDGERWFIESRPNGAIHLGLGHPF
jgi:outer membrane protein assembly factor BamA